MTRLGMDSCESSSLPKIEVPLPSLKNATLPRFNLKKRSVSGEREHLHLTTVNSAFLSGLFADVANVTGAPDSDQGDFGSSEAVTISEFSEDIQPVKKTRLSKSKSIARNARSYKILSEAVVSPSNTQDHVRSCVREMYEELERQDSLYFQLNCVSSSSSNESHDAFAKTVFDTGRLEFPLLPASISDSSCSTLTRTNSDLKSSFTENWQKDSYGWFVEMDDEKDDVISTINLSSPATTVSPLAFAAPTAPKAANFDAEVEWAKAADTVDDVLGDFF